MSWKEIKYLKPSIPSNLFEAGTLFSMNMKIKAVSKIKDSLIKIKG